MSRPIGAIPELDGNMMALPSGRKQAEAEERRLATACVHRMAPDAVEMLLDVLGLTETDGRPPKRCTKCKETKPVTSFNRKTGSGDGRRSECSDCCNARKRERSRATKRCPRCKDVKAVVEFDRNRSRADGRATECKTCRAEMYEASRNNTPVASKRCTKCKDVKAAGQFAVDRSSSTGLTPQCKPCRNATKRERGAAARAAGAAGPKDCSKCGGTKPAAEFYRDANNADGLNSWCKGCNDRAWQIARDRREARRRNAA